MIRTVHAVITGMVQGVGYRAWVEREAVARGLSGWVRNRRDGSVEAVFSGEEGAVQAMLVACHSGPRMAVVEHIAVANVVADPTLQTFRVLAAE